MKWLIQKYIFQVSRFTKCDTCENLKQAMGQSGSKKESEAYSTMRKNHLKLAREGRKKYHGHINKADEDPMDVLSINIDKADQSTTALPLTDNKGKVQYL